jgi:hypothetical protein
MSSGHRQVLLAGVSGAAAQRVVKLLTPFDVSIHRIPWSDRQLRTAVDREFDAIIIGYPVGGPHIDFVLGALRSTGSLSRHAGIILICEWDALPDARLLVDHGADLVVSHEASDEVWRDLVLSLVDVSHRIELHARLRLTAELKGEPLIAECHTENVSISGMLVRCPKALGVSVGSKLRFAMQVPGEDAMIRGEACVTRTTNPERERFDGIGARFVSFSESDRARLGSVLRKGSTRRRCATP